MDSNNELSIAKQIQTLYPCISVFIKDEAPYTLYNAKDVARLINVRNARTSIRHISSTEKQVKVCQTKGGPQNMVYLTLNGIKQFLSNSRKPFSREFAKILRIEINEFKVECVESSTIRQILTAFHGERMIDQYSVLKYRIDLYFPKYKLAIECDESQHNVKIKKENDTIRMNEIQIELQCNFIRYDPFDKLFSIFNVINQIFHHIQLKKY